ncbi:MAG: TetR/AcrR family transcriptional regulator [Sphingomonadales bacterium]|nr:TetR/AcrR family transcriptional regulator [Sphingomonadales bacterium]
MSVPECLPCPGRREANRLSRREAILDVAQASFLERGYAATTMSAIAAQLGGSKGTLWSYFAAKDLLFEAVLDRATVQFQARITQALNPRDGLSESLHAFARQFLERITAPDAIALYRLVIGEARRFPETGRIFHERAPGRTRQTLATYLEAAMARGQLRAGDAMGASRQLMSLCMGGCHQQLLLGLIDKAPKRAIAEEAELAVDSFLRAYAV